MNTTKTHEYLARINFKDTHLSSLDIETLFALQQAHLQAVPYENLNIYFAEQPQPLQLSINDLFDKIVKNKRGGICYELNFLYADLLRSLGFDARLIAARVKETGTEFDHVAILVELPKDAVQEDSINDSPDDLMQSNKVNAANQSLWLTDVGFGHASALPLKFAVGKLQDDGRDQYCFFETVHDGETWYELGRSAGLCLSEEEPLSKDSFERAFDFRLQYRSPEEYVARSTYYATDDSSVFRNNPVISIDNGEERTTLSKQHFIQTRNGVREERSITYPEEFEQLLHDIFGITLKTPLPN